MEIFHNEGYSKAKLNRINKCRIYVQALTVSDVMNGSGNGFNCTYKCLQNKEQPSSYLWPRQQKPSAKYITDWKSALRNSFEMKLGKTAYTLGRWLSSPDHSWKWLFSPQLQLLYENYGNTWKVWSRVHSQGVLGRRSKFKYISPAFSTPNDAVRATIHRIDHRFVYLSGWSQHLPFSSQLIRQQILPNWILQQVHSTPAIDLQLAQHITQGTLLAVSDGSYFDEHKTGGAAWYIESPSSMAHSFGCCITPGPPSAQNAFRSELMGILGLIVHINKIATTHNISTGTVTIQCDGESALNAVNSHHSIIHNNRKHFDLLQSIHGARKITNIKWKFQHVKGHLDDDKDFEDLSRSQQLNVLADKKAKTHVLHTITSNISSTLQQQNLPYLNCEIIITMTDGAKQKVHSKLLHTIRDNISTKKIRKYWLEKKNITHLESSIDWELKRKSKSNFPKGLNRWLAKHTTGFCGVGTKLEQYAYQTHSKCPRCGANGETPSHVIKCKEETACQLWDKEMISLSAWMKKEKIQTDIRNTIIHNLNSWKYNTTPASTLPQNDHLKQAILQQDCISWTSFVEGFWSKSWRYAQSAYLTSIASTKSPLLLLSKTQRKIWMIAWEMWTHRNEHLHTTCKSVHPEERPDIDSEIQQEWDNGTSSLPLHSRGLMQGSLEQTLQMSYSAKRQWLTTIWTARETLNPNYLKNNPSSSDMDTTRFRYERWKARRKKVQ